MRIYNLKAYGLKPIFLGGGSYLMGDNAEMFPQISDPVAKSSVGLLLDQECDLLKELDAVLIVANNDISKVGFKLFNEGIFKKEVMLYKRAYDLMEQENFQGLPNYRELDVAKGSVSKASIAFQHKSAFNSGTISNVERVELPKNTDGIIYYRLKGQTSQAYEAERMEELAIAQNVPFLCVETDYTYTDSEQMKIRVEAFYEMLSANKRKSVTV